MRKTKLGLNVLLSVSYVVIIVCVLAVITLSVTSYLGKHFLSNREEEQHKVLEDCASALMPYLEEMEPNYVYGVLSTYARQGNGRMLFVDRQGCVQSDTFCTLNGTKPYSEEIEAVLQGKSDFSVGYHNQKILPTEITKDNAFLAGATDSYWSGYYVRAISSFGEQKGAVILIAPVQDIVKNVGAVTNGLFVFSIILIILVAAFALFLSSSLTSSIRKFNRAISKMSSGKFSARVDENEIAEFGELAKAFNMMSERLENLDASRSQFVSDASHELKTPLASMKILSESLLTQPDAPVELYREFMTDINSEVDRLSLVINDLLTLVKTDKGSETLVIARVQLGEVIKQIISTVEPLARDKHITVLYDYVDVTVYVDELRVRQVFTNLIDNAIKYSPENTTVTVTLTQTISNAVVTVADQGIGIAQEHLPHLFERFYRVDKARSRQAGGTGLGLSIVKQIIEQHEGEITVKSETGVGTTFTVTLPIAKQ